MNWIAKSMTDPGDGIVTTTKFEHESDDICEVSADLMNGQGTFVGDPIQISGWLFSLEAVPE